MAMTPERQREYYRENRKTLIAGAVIRNKKHRRIKRGLVTQAKAKPCSDCGNTYPSHVMQFDHVRGKKEFNLSEAGNRGVSYDKILLEISKCDVVCANCHAIRTFERRAGV